MRRITTGRTTALGALLFLLVAHPTKPQQQTEKEWTWKDRDGKTRTRADLDRILAEHKLWVESKHSRGKRADLSGADLRDADLDYAELSGADLGGKEFVVSENRSENFAITHFSWPKPGANLEGARLRSVNFSDADMTDTDLRDAILSSANLSDASLFYANLVGTDLTDTELKGAEVADVDFEGAVFEPKSMPEIREIASSKNLEFLTYNHNPDALVQLRKLFQDDGFRLQERKVTYAIKRQEAESSREDCTSRMFLDGKRRALLWSSDSKLSNCGSFVLNLVFFDWTCQYGMNPGRPLNLGVFLWLFCSVLYFVCSQVPGKAGLYRVYTENFNGDPSAEQRVERISASALAEKRGVRRLLHFIWREWAVFRVSMFFSLMSAFNIGFRDINFGRWLRLLTRQEFDIKAVGWPRVIAGWQSLISVYFIALWVLTYFGRPFG